MTVVYITCSVFARECLGILWKAVGVELVAYYPIAVATGLAVVADIMTFILRRIAARYAKAIVKSY